MYRRTSQPINIEQSSPADHYSIRRQCQHGHQFLNPSASSNSTDEDIVDDNEKHTLGMRNISSSFGNMTHGFDNLTVGSLPSSRRERRFMVSHGNNERIGRNNNGNNNIKDSSNEYDFSYSHASANNRPLHKFDDLSQSLPVPRAPFLASRRDRATVSRLSRIPSMSLPESVADGSEASSVPYGSLNASQFLIPPQNSLSQSQNINASANNLSSSINLSRPTLNIQERVQEIKSNGTLIRNEQGGLASLFGGGGEASGVGNYKQANLEETDEERKQSFGSKSGGIGSLIEQSSPAIQLKPFNGALSAENISNSNCTPLISTPADVTRNSIEYAVNVNAPSGTIVDKTNNHSTNDEFPNQLSTSMTALSILESSPRGQMVTLSLSHEEKEALTKRSRSLSDEVKTAFLSSMSSEVEAGHINILHLGPELDGKHVNSATSNILHCNGEMNEQDGGEQGHIDDDQDEFFDMDM